MFATMGCMFTAATTELEGFDPRPLSRPELADALAAHDRVIARAEANRLAILAAVDALGDRGADAATMGRSVSRRSERRAKSDAKVAAVLGEMPAVAEKLETGEITSEHVALCADAAGRLSPGQADELASMAAAMPADRFAKKSREWISRRESALQIEQRHRRQRRKREATTWTSGDGMVHLHAQFDPVTGQSVIAALAERTDRLWRDDGGRTGTPDDVRSHAQRRADALAELITAEPEATANAAPHPRFMVTSSTTSTAATRPSSMATPSLPASSPRSAPTPKSSATSSPATANRCGTAAQSDSPTEPNGSPSSPATTAAPTAPPRWR